MTPNDKGRILSSAARLYNHITGRTARELRSRNADLACQLFTKERECEDLTEDLKDALSEAGSATRECDELRDMMYKMPESFLALTIKRDPSAYLFRIRIDVGAELFIGSSHAPSEIARQVEYRLRRYAEGKE